MATNLDVITDAFRVAGILNEKSTLSGSKGQTGLTLLNDMMSDWEEDGIELGYFPQTLVSDTIPIDDEHLRGVKYNLARAVSSRFPIEMPPETLRIAELTFARLAKATTEDFTTDFSHMPTGQHGTFDVVTD